MSKRWIAGLAVMAAGLIGAIALTPGGGVSEAAGMKMYSVTIENLTSGQAFTPPVLVVHSSGADVFEVGEEASGAVQGVAENGDVPGLVGALEGAAGVHSVVVADGPVMPGASVTLMVEAEEGYYLSWVSMLICTNDGFTGLDSVHIEEGTLMTDGYDAGTETNTEYFGDLVPPCQAITGVSTSVAGTGMSNPDLAEGGVIAHHPGVAGDGGAAHLRTVHQWTDPVAEVTISAVKITAPDTGSGGLLDSGSQSSVLYALALIAVVAGVSGVAMARVRGS